MSTVDPKEIEKFSKLSQAWWDTEGELKTLHDINPARKSYVQQHCNLNAKLLLDVGCGGGILSESLAQAGAVVTAIDMDSNAIVAAKAHQETSQSHVEYRYQDVTELASQQPESYDLITCMEMLEHVPDPRQIIRTCSQLLKPGGSLFLSTINRTAKAYGLAVLGAEYLLGILPKGTHDYQKFIKPSELVGICREFGLECKDLSGISYNPFNRKAKLTSNLSVNYIACFQR